MQDNKINQMLRRFVDLQNNRSTWEQHYQEIQEYVSPSPNYFHGNKPTQGAKNNWKLFDPTATQALNRFVAAISSTLTPRSSRWHRLATPSLPFNENVALYLEQVTDILFNVRYSPAGNFSSQIDECYHSLGKYGTCCMLIDDDIGKGIRYRSIHLSEVYVAEGADGTINTVYRKFDYTVQKLIEQFGEENLPKVVLDKRNLPDTEFSVMHIVCPNEDYTGQHYDDMRYCSCYILPESKHILSEGGYRTFPYAVSRYRTEAGEVYGRSPAMDMLPEIKSLNRLRKAHLTSVDKLANPPILASDDAAEAGINMQAGGINYGAVNEEGRPMIMPFNAGARVDISKDEIDQMRQMINDAFLVTLFQIMVQTPEMTATEVQYRQQEKGEMLAPTMGRQQTELISKIIERELDILSMAGVLPPMPQELIDAGGIIEVSYEAPLNKIMRSNEAAAILQTLQTAAGLAQFDPSILKMFDMEEAMRIIADIWGVPISIIHSPEEIAAMKDQQAQQAQLQQVLQAAPIVSQSAKNLAQAQTEATAAKPYIPPSN